MRFDLVSLFPQMFDAVAQHGITGRALAAGRWQAHHWNPRDAVQDNYRRIDDRPYGGGPGMVMMAQPLADTLAAVAAAQAATIAPAARLVLCLSPQGRPLTHRKVTELATMHSLTLIAGRYEGIDQRFLDHHVDEEIAVGDFVVSGGELPAMMIIDAIVRLLPGAVNDPSSVREDSFADGLLDCPHYTRPETWQGQAVPPVLLSGDHAKIAAWRREQALAATARRRPDLLASARLEQRLDANDLRFLKRIDPGR